MAETRTTTKKETEDKPESSGDVEYVDKGHYWEIHDKRLGGDVVTTAPKTQRDVPLPEKEQKEVTERLKMEQEILDTKAEEAKKVEEPPPVKASDEEEKVDEYESVPSILRYVVVESETRCVRMFWREPGERVWRREPFDTEGPLQLPEFGATLTF